MKLFCLLVIATNLVCFSVLGTAHAGPTLDAIKARGFVRCGVHRGLKGFCWPDDKGNLDGFDVDMCRALAAAIFGDKNKVDFTPTLTEDRFRLLQSGKVDVLSRNTTWTFSRDTSLDLDFAGVTFYDGQSFMVRKSLGKKSALELNGASICVITGTTTELNLAEYFRANGMKYKPVVVKKSDDAVMAYDAGKCDVFTTDRSGLATTMIRLSRPDDHMILREIISKEPLGPVVRHGDNQWGDIVRWSINAMIIAEEKGVTSVNVDKMKKATDPEIRRLLGIEGDFGKMLNLSNDWAYWIIKLVGNYGEVYERNLGYNTPFKLERGLNELYSKKGGILFAPPMH